MDKDTVIEIFGVTKEYSLEGRQDKVCALRDINLNDESVYKGIKRGEFVIIRGPSGGGKTTLLNITGSIDSASSGSIYLLGKPIDHKSSDEYLSRLRLEHIGFVFQSFNLIATMTAQENVELPMRILKKLQDKEIVKKATRLLSRVGLQDRLDHLPSELSGGEQQRVAIARSLANSPAILLLDEPTGDLDTMSTVDVMNLLHSLNNRGYDDTGEQPITMVMVTHNPDLELYAHRILYVRDGALVKQVFNAEQHTLDYPSYIQYLESQQQ